MGGCARPNPDLGLQAAQPCLRRSDPERPLVGRRASAILAPDLAHIVSRTRSRSRTSRLQSRGVVHCNTRRRNERRQSAATIPVAETTCHRKRRWLAIRARAGSRPARIRHWRTVVLESSPCECLSNPPIKALPADELLPCNQNFACEQFTWWVLYAFTVLPFLPAPLSTTLYAHAQHVPAVFLSLSKIFDWRLTTLWSVSRNDVVRVAIEVRQWLQRHEGLYWNYSIWGPISMSLLFYASTDLTERISASKYP